MTPSFYRIPSQMIIRTAEYSWLPRSRADYAKVHCHRGKSVGESCCAILQAHRWLLHGGPIGVRGRGCANIDVFALLFD